MKVALVSTYDMVGGAAAAALRLHHALHLVGIGAHTYVRTRYIDDRHIVEVSADTAEEEVYRRDVDRIIAAEQAPYSSLHGEAFFPFGTERAGLGLSLVNRLPAADVINLHWVRDLLDWESFFATRPPGQAVVWTLHDAQPFTGGCHYPGDCGGFQTACGSCPRLGSTRSDDLSALVLQRKRNVLSRFANRLSVVTPSRWMADLCRRSSLFADLPVTVIPNSVNTDLFMPGDRQQARAELGLPSGTSIVLFVSQDISDPRKGLPLLTDALGAIAEGRDLMLVTVGQAPQPVAVPVRHVHFDLIADAHRLRTIYVAADLLALPSLEDNLPNTGLEAMACGTPVVALPAGGVPDIVDESCGLLAPAMTVEALAAVLRAALDDPPRLAEMGVAARRRAEREYALTVQGQRYKKHFQSMLTEADRRSPHHE